MYEDLDITMLRRLEIWFAIIRLPPGRLALVAIQGIFQIGGTAGIEVHLLDRMRREIVHVLTSDMHDEVMGQFEIWGLDKEDKLCYF